MEHYSPPGRIPASAGDRCLLARTDDHAEADSRSATRRNINRQVNAKLRVSPSTIGSQPSVSRTRRGRGHAGPMDGPVRPQAADTDGHHHGITGQVRHRLAVQSSTSASCWPAMLKAGSLVPNGPGYPPRRPRPRPRANGVTDPRAAHCGRSYPIPTSCPPSGPSGPGHRRRRARSCGGRCSA
jgi:hypothetical protein